ncbi:crAss001_48 related protein [Lactobacillus kitasatonis]|uniref:crAss001_48 related protein n=1 Tax=Lactobacillus kitasatonis TaxID=237446 RepID=UPI0026EE8B1E|nr:hypothetical protein [Lactobacillus kitasatonis]
MKIKPPTRDEIRLDDLKNEKAEVDAKLLDLDNFLFEHRGGLEYEEKRLLRVQRTIMYSYSTVLVERITALKETIRKYYEN